MKRILGAAFLILMISGCNLMQRSTDSGYAGQWDDVGEPSYSGRTRTLSQSERRNLEESVEVRRLETNIRSEEEYEQYNKYRENMSAKERAEFLAMRNSSARNRYIQAKGIRENQNRYSRTIASIVEDGDITIGMPKEAVRESWGDPELVEVAGNPELGNERWTYRNYISTTEGYQREDRLVYFERGTVVGWEQQ